jgi:hypothetical protein
MEDETTVQCPHCFESQCLVVDPDTEGELVQDCDVCCRPWSVYVARDEDGTLNVTVTGAY